MESLEVNAKTVDEAVEIALQRLDARLSEVEIVVLSEGRAGILGLGAEDARIRVTKLDANQVGRSRISSPNFPPRPPAISYASSPGLPQDEDDFVEDETQPPNLTSNTAPPGQQGQQRGGGRQGGGGRGDRGRQGGGPPRQGGGGQGGGPPRPGGGSQSPGLRSGDRFRQGTNPNAGGGYGAGPGTTAYGGQRADGEGDRPRTDGDRDRPRSNDRRPQGPPAPRVERPLTPPPPPSSPLAAQAAEIIQEMVNRLGLRAVVAETKPPADDPASTTPTLAFDIQGDDLGSLIGRRGQTLSSLQYLVNVMMRQQSKESVMIVVDVEGYRARRYQTLQNLAQRMADRVRSSGQPVTLEPMTAAERRIIHMTLKQYPELSTQSSGEGENRKVTITPKQG